MQIIHETTRSLTRCHYRFVAEDRFAFVGRVDGRAARGRDAIRVRTPVEHVDAVQRQREGLEHTDNGSVHQILVDRVRRFQVRVAVVRAAALSTGRRMRNRHSVGRKGPAPRQ